MAIIAKIDEESITADDFVKMLKITNVFQNLIKDIVSDKLTVNAAKKHGITVASEEAQEKADQFRRVRGLHRAKETNEYLERIGFSLDEFETYISDTLYKEKMVKKICNDNAVEEYFRLNSPKFESVDLSHILLDSEAKAKEVMACLEEDLESFAAMAKEHSLSAGTKEKGGTLGRVRRGLLPAEIEAKVFNASSGDVLGPFPSEKGDLFEIFKVDSKMPARLDDQARAEVCQLLHRQWLANQAREHKIAVL